MGYTGNSLFLRCTLIVAAVLIVGAGAFAQDELSPQEVLKEAIKMADIGNYQEAILLMYQYLEIVEDSEADRVVSIAQDIRFKLARILIEEGELTDAAEVLKVYTSTKLCKYPRAAMRMLATCYYETEDWENCVTAVQDALEYNENPVVVVKAVSDENEGVLSTDDGPGDVEYTPEELVMLHLTLAESFYNLGEWEQSVPPFEYVIEHTTDEQRKGYAIMQVINALIFLEDFDRISEWIPKLYRTNARYDIRVNLGLMNAAAALYEAGEYDSALPLYRMILPRDEVIAFQQERLKAMRLKAGLIPIEDTDVDPIELMLFSAEVGEEEDDAEIDDADKPRELVELEALIAALEKLPAYENNIAYQVGQLYERVNRYWEAVEFFDAVYGREPGTDLGQRAVADVVSVLLENLNEVDEATMRGFSHLATHTNGLSPRQIGYTFTGYFYKNEDWEKIKELQPYLDNLTRTNDTDILKYDAELYFMQGVADLSLYKFEEAEAGFQRILDEYPESHQEASAIFWNAMAKLYQQKYKEVMPIFEQYIADYEDGDWVDESYFQGGVCLFGMEDYVAASNRFSFVMETFPDSPIYPHACIYRGNLEGAAGSLDLAITDYRSAIEASVRLNNVKKATEATFEMADIYEAEAEVAEEQAVAQEKYQQIIDVVQTYLDTWEDEADVARALFWLGKIKIKQDRVEEAMTTYLDAIVRFGDDVLQDGVDMMIAELVKVSRVWLGVQAQGELMRNIQATLDAAEDPVLQLRLRVLMAKLDGTEIELGKRLIEELPSLDIASPPVLAVICDASFDMKDYSRAEELLNIFLTRFEESDYVRAAYKLRAYGQLNEKDYAGALFTIDEVQGLYGHDLDVVWAQLMKAQILLAQGKLDEAREANMYVLSVPQWRGVPVAQATYQMGQVEEKAGNLRKAFGFYQRTYVQYKGHSRGYWAAESYLASARVLEKLELEDEQLNTYRAMLYDSFVSTLPQADVARKALGSGEVAEIEAFMATGESTNITVAVDTGEMVDTTLSQTNRPEPEEGTADEPADTETDNAMDIEEMPDDAEASDETAADKVGTEGE